MPDLGEPSSYLSLGKGGEVYTCDGEKVGKVEHVLAVPEDDIFDGIVLDTSILPGGHRFVDAEQVEEIFERGVLLKIDRATADALPEPTANPGAVEVGPDELSDPEQSALRQKLGRAWDLLSGKR
ncbi:MAG: PRC-barrel domain-containing protein [Solirubrobacterales bacterium]